MEDLPRGPPQLERQNSDARESFLIEYATNKSINQDEICLEEGWSICKEYGIDVVARLLKDGMVDKKPFGNRGYSSLYSISFMLCAQANTPDHSSTIYNNINTAVASFLTETVVQPLLDPNLVGVPMIGKFSRAWDNHKIMVKWVQMLFRHLDKGYVTNSGQVKTLTSCGMTQFLEVAFGGTCVRVRNAILDMIDSERDGATVDRNEIRNCIEVFIVMGLAKTNCAILSVASMKNMETNLSVYEEDLEKGLLESTEQYYVTQSVGWRDQETVAEYLIRCEKCLTEERNRPAPCSAALPGLRCFVRRRIPARAPQLAPSFVPPPTACASRPLLSRAEFRGTSTHPPRRKFG